MPGIAIRNWFVRLMLPADMGRILERRPAAGMIYRTAPPRPLREGAPARPTSPPSPLREGASSMVDEPASRPAAAFETLSAAMRYEAREVFLHPRIVAHQTT